MARAGGNPDISKAGEKYRWKKNQSGNPKGGIKKFAFEEMYCEEFKAFAGAKPPLTQIRELIEKLNSLTRAELMEFAMNPNMPFSVVVHAQHLLKAASKRGTTSDLKIITELTAPKGTQTDGSELPPVPIVNLNIYAEKAKETE